MSKKYPTKIKRIGIVFMLIIISGLFLFACESGDDTQYDTHYDKLMNEGKSATITDVNYESSDNYSIDYSDDTRELIDVGGLTDDDVITIPDPAFEAVIREYFSIVGDITYGDVRYIDQLRIYSSNIESIVGIEYFESLETLRINRSPLASINGIQTLPHLDRVNIEHTYVKKIDYPTANVSLYHADNTLVDYTPEELIEMFETSSNMRSLRLRNTPVRVNKTLYDYVMSHVEEDNQIFIKVDYNQIDFDTLGYRDFWQLEDDFWLNMFVEPHVVIGEDFNLNDEVYDTLFIDITDNEEWDAISEYLNTWITNIGLEYANNELEKILLVYDYFLENITIDSEGSHFILDALEGNPVTSVTAYETMALFYRYIGIPSYAYLLEYEYFGADEYASNINFLIVFYNNQRYAIHFDENLTYEYFMVGQETEQNIISTEFDPPSFYSDVARYDLSRDSVETAAQVLNIDLNYE